VTSKDRKSSKKRSPSESDRKRTESDKVSKDETDPVKKERKFQETSENKKEVKSETDKEGDKPVVLDTKLLDDIVLPPVKVEESKQTTLFPMVNKDGDLVSFDVDRTDVPTVTETTLVSYPTLNKAASAVDKSSRQIRKRRASSEDRRSPEDKSSRRRDRRRHTDDEGLKAISSLIKPMEGSGIQKRDIRELPKPRAEKPVSLRVKEGWDPFQSETQQTFGDHDDRDMGWNQSVDSYTIKERRGGGRFNSRGRFNDRRDDRRGGDRRGDGRQGGDWTRERSSFGKAGINADKWSHDMFQKEEV